MLSCIIPKQIQPVVLKYNLYFKLNLLNFLNILLNKGGKVIIWSSDLNDSSNNPLSVWKSTVLHEFNSVAWHVSWSLTSNMLAVSTGDNKVNYY